MLVASPELNFLQYLSNELQVFKKQGAAVFKEQAAKPIEKAQQVVQGFKGLFSKVVGAANSIGQHIVSEASSSANSSQVKPLQPENDYPRFHKTSSEP